MHKFKVPSGEIDRRIKKIRKELQDNGIDGLLIVQRVDLFYFSGTAHTGFLYIPAEGQPVLFIKRYLPRAREESSIKNIIEVKSIKEVPGFISDFYGKLPGTIGLEFDVLPVRDFNFYKRLFAAEKFVDGSHLIHKVRMIKSDWEIEQIEKTAELSQKTFEYMKSAIRPGLTEMEFSGMYETFARKLGHGAKLRVRDYQTEGYPWHILSGTNGGLLGLLDSPASGEGTSAAFPCGGGNKLLAADEPIMIDLGSVLNGYHMDETRMFAIESMPVRAMNACRAAIEIHNAVLEIVKPGISLDELFRHSVETAKSLGYAEPYLGPPGHEVSFVGHGIGLELIEFPIIAGGKKERLEPGMTFALEPKMVFENEFSAGIESVFLVTETGARLISKMPLEIFIC
ncbi:MAG: Xaa-Pro peptidase family protein [Desulfobacterales bacterium]|nr:Xaa-Pro peptidase family protein [Desulfobacterales bacterium]MDX2508627.1 Xaa-Pro peptidase family protein [Desulfobacterales bacterium]